MKKIDINIHNIILILITIVFLLIILIPFCSCTNYSGAVTGSGSPELLDCEIYGECEGGEKDQYIIAEMVFDKTIKFSDKLGEHLRIVIGGERISEDNVVFDKIGEDTIIMRINVDRVTDGRLEVTNAPGITMLSAITDESERFCVESININRLIPSGVVISLELQKSGYVVYRVDSAVNHRSIIWIRLLCSGKTIRPENIDSTDFMEEANAVAVHEHEFLWADTESTAAHMAETINTYYGSVFESSASGGLLTISAKDPACENIELEIYEG